jgi:hypothetical protein
MNAISGDNVLLTISLIQARNAGFAQKTKLIDVFGEVSISFG